MLAPLAVYLSIMLIICTLLLMVIWAHDTVGHRGPRGSSGGAGVPGSTRVRERVKESNRRFRMPDSEFANQSLAWINIRSEFGIRNLGIHCFIEYIELLNNHKF